MLSKAERIAASHYLRFFDTTLSFSKILDEITNRIYKKYPPKVIINPEFLNLDTYNLIQNIEDLAFRITEVTKEFKENELTDELPF